ncbi:hypothetical protein Patl1_35915 [Pistacia atlantica]|nr:hypothetical protein Patl1_35915 [Pistacia atlantica]
MPQKNLFRLQDVVSVDMHAAKGLLSSGHCYLDVR